MASEIQARTNIIQTWLEHADQPWQELRVPDEHERLLAKFNPATLELEIRHEGCNYCFNLGAIVVEYNRSKFG